MESLSLLANNLANATTSGYKSDSEFYGLYTSPDADSSSEASTLPSIERQWTDFSQGTLQPTGNPLDVAISGPGFLTVAGPGGDLYTRNGNLHVSRTGDLVGSEGFSVRGVGGGAIHLTSGAPVEIAPDGTVRQEGHTGSTGGRKLQVHQFSEKDERHLFPEHRFEEPSCGGQRRPGAAGEAGRLERGSAGSRHAAGRGDAAV
jgi:flagellar basal body rod protein FlgG